MSVTVIIPTTCDAERGPLLRRAIASVAGQLPEGGCIQVVANGAKVDADVMRMASGFPHTQVHRLPEANVALAQRFGRQAVRTEYFCFLDDDDEYLPDALSVRMAALRADDTVDVVVTNGYTHADGRDSRRLDYLDAARNDALRTLLVENWLASCGGMFRARTVAEDLFDGRTRYFEWTLLAFKLALNRVVRFIDVPTFRVNVRPGSVSKSRAYREAELGVLADIAALDLPPDVRRAIQVKMGKAEHGLSAYFLGLGEWQRALLHHARSLRSAGGLRYLAYSRKLLLPPRDRGRGDN